MAGASMYMSAMAQLRFKFLVYSSVLLHFRGYNFFLSFNCRRR